MYLLDTVDLSTDGIIYFNLKSYLKHNLSFLGYALIDFNALWHYIQLFDMRQ